MRQPVIGDLLLNNDSQHGDLIVGIIEKIEKEKTYKGKVRYFVRWPRYEGLSWYFIYEIRVLQTNFLKYCKEQSLSVGWDYEDIKAKGW